MEYDTRDFIPNPYKGLYLSLKGTWRPDFLGSNAKSLWQAIFTANSYHRVWKGGIVATELYGEFNASGTPWLMKAAWVVRSVCAATTKDNTTTTI